MTIKELLIITGTELYKEKEGGKVVCVEIRPRGRPHACFVTVGKTNEAIRTVGEGATDKIRNQNLVKILRGNTLLVMGSRFPIPKTLMT